MRTIPPTWLALPAVLVCLGQTARADERLFTFSYQATTVPKGAFELETWATFEPGRRGEPDVIEFRHELEYGLTDNLQLSVYLADWSWTDPFGDDELEYEDSAVVLKVEHLDPATDAFGLATYHEVKVGDEILALENKLILQKNVDRWMMVGNLTLEAEWEGERYGEDEGELITSIGAAYQVTPRFFAGFEAFHELEIEDWEELENAGLYAGPTLSYRLRGAGDWWITASVVDQVTDVGGEPDWMARLIVGTSF